MSEELATQAQFAQEDIPTALARIQEEITALTNPTSKSFKAITVELPGAGQINKMSDLYSLYAAAGSIIAREEWYNKAGERLTTTSEVPPFQLKGYSTQEWLDLIEARINTVGSAERIADLKKLETALSNLLSEEDKKKQQVIEVGKLMQKLVPNKATTAAVAS